MRLERNTMCEKMIKKFISKTIQKPQRSHKKSCKVSEIPAYKNPQSILKPKTTNNDENQKHLDVPKVKKIELKNKRYSKRCASFNGTINSNKIQTSVELTNESSRKIKYRRKSVYESYKDENIAETLLPRSEIKLVSKEKYSFKDRHSRETISKDIEKPVVEDGPSNDINNVVDTTSKDDSDTCNKIIYTMKLKRSKCINMEMSQISSSDDKVFEDEEFKSDKSVEHKADSAGETDANETEMLCYVLSSSTEVINIKEEISELDKKPDLSVKNESVNSAISVDKLSDECNNSSGEVSEEYHDSSDEQSEDYHNSTVILVDKCEISVDKKIELCDTQVSEECHNSTDLLVHESDNHKDQQTEEYDNSADQDSEEFDKSAEKSEECEKAVNQLTKEKCDGSAEKASEEFEKPADQVTEGYEFSGDLRYDKDETKNHQINEYTEPAEHITEECNEPVGQLEEEYTDPAGQLEEEHTDPTEQITEECNEPAEQLEEEYYESAEQITEEYSDTNGQITEECNEPIQQLEEEYTKLAEKYSESMNQLTEVCEETVDHLTNECATSVSKIDKEKEGSAQVTGEDETSMDHQTQESDKSSGQQKKSVDQKSDDSVISVKNLSKICNKPAYQISADCYKSVEPIDSDEFVKSPVYTNVEHLEEETDSGFSKHHNMTKIREKTAAFSVIFNNNNITAFDIRAKAKSIEKVTSNEDSDERNSFSPVQDQTDKANNEARACKRDLTNLIDSLYSNENENSKGEPIDLVTAGSSFDNNQNQLQTSFQTALQTTIPPLKKRRKTQSPETLIQKHFAIQSRASPVHSEVLPTKNRVISLEESLPYVASASFSAVSAFSLLEKLKAEQLYLESKHEQQQLLIESQIRYKKSFNYQTCNAPNNMCPGVCYRNHESSQHVPNNNFTTVPKSTNNYQLYPYNNRNPELIQDQTINKTTATVTRPNHPNYPVNNYNSNCDLNNFAAAGSSREYNKRKSNNMVFPIYNRGLKKESQHSTVSKIDEKAFLKDLATSQASNFSDKFVPYKRRQTAIPRNSKTTRFITEQSRVSREMCYPITPITVMKNSNASRYLQQNQTIVNQETSYLLEPIINITNSSPTQFLQEQSIIDDDISYPSKPMMSIANTCTCDLQNYASCSLHPRNFELEAKEYISHPIQEGGVKAKNINDLLPLPISNHRYGNNSRKKLSTESDIDFNVDLSDVAANEEVFDYSNVEFGVDESPGETGEFEEAYVNYVPSRMNYRKPRSRQTPKPQTKPLTQPPTKTTRKSVTKSLTKSVAKLTPYHFAMSPPNPPDSTSTTQLQTCIDKKRGRPKGRLN